MQTYISILRGINVSGQKLIKMDALRKMFEDIKFKKVKTYIQSGNVIFESSKSTIESLEKKIMKGIKESFGFDVPVLVKDLSELKIVLKNNPFLKKQNEDVSKLHVTFLSEIPSKENVEKIQAGNYGADEFVLEGKNIYLFCPNGYGNTKLTNNFFENKLKLSATTRNWKTVNELVSIAENDNS